jgi:hypothetical protein
LHLGQERYADPWQHITCCVLCSRTSGGSTIHNAIAEFFANLPTPTAVLAAPGACMLVLRGVHAALASSACVSARDTARLATRALRPPTPTLPTAAAPRAPADDALLQLLHPLGLQASRLSAVTSIAHAFLATDFTDPAEFRWRRRMCVCVCVCVCLPLRVPAQLPADSAHSARACHAA